MYLISIKMFKKINSYIINILITFEFKPGGQAIKVLVAIISYINARLTSKF